VKYFLLLLILYSHSFALSINESLLTIHATLVPKLIFMDTHYREKLDNNALSIIIFHSKQTKKSAETLQKNINKRYPDGIKSYPIKVTLLPYSHKQAVGANIYYFLPADERKIKKIIAFAKEKKALTFSYLKENLAQGSIIALEIGRKVKPILNLSALKESNISVRDILLKISTIYKKEEAY